MPQTDTHSVQTYNTSFFASGVKKRGCLEPRTPRSLTVRAVFTELRNDNNNRYLIINARNHKQFSKLD